MSGETDLTSLLAAMRPELQEGLFVFASMAPGGQSPEGLSPIMTFREKEGLTLVLARDEAERAGIASEFPCRWIALRVHSSLQAVGLLAAITRRLGDAGISVNAVSAFYHDHLFVPPDRADEAIELLAKLGSDLR